MATSEMVRSEYLSASRNLISDLSEGHTIVGPSAKLPVRDLGQRLVTQEWIQIPYEVICKVPLGE